MCACIDHSTKNPRIITRDNDRHSADLRRKKIILLGDLTLMRDEHPVAFENIFELELKYVGVGEGGAVNLVYAARLVLDQPGL